MKYQQNSFGYPYYAMHQRRLSQRRCNKSIQNFKESQDKFTLYTLKLTYTSLLPKCMGGGVILLSFPLVFSDFIIINSLAAVTCSFHIPCCIFSLNLSRSFLQKCTYTNGFDMHQWSSFLFIVLIETTLFLMFIY